MTPEELVEIKARHWKIGGRGTVYPEQCVCGLMWPCDAGRLLAEVERLQEGLRAILKGHACDPEFPETHPWARCTICSPQEKRWPCSTVLEARAALEGKP